MTDNDENETRTLGEMSHTNPYTNEVFGSTQTYNRGQMAVTDGGEDGAVATDADAEEEQEQTMGDVDHTPPKNAPSASAAYMEGNENAEE